MFRRTWAALLLPAVLAATGCASHPPASQRAADPENSPVEQVTMDPLTGLTPIECGQRFTPPAGSPLTVTGRFPPSVAAADLTLAGEVDVVSPTAVRGVGPPQADVFLVGDGKVMTLPITQDSVGVAWDLVAGVPLTLPASGSLALCGPNGGTVVGGSYQLYARVTLTPEGAGVMEAFGGPWPLTVA